MDKNNRPVFDDLFDQFPEWADALNRMDKDSEDSYDELPDAFYQLIDLMRLFPEKQISPDPFYCESLFLEFFISPEMESEFPKVIRAFLSHEGPDLLELTPTEFISNDSVDNTPSQMINAIFLNMMYSRACTGDDYSRSLFLNLYKTFYKQEYKQLKHFRTISAEEILSVSSKDESLDPVVCARTLVMAHFMGIETEPGCNAL